MTSIYGAILSFVIILTPVIYSQEATVKTETKVEEEVSEGSFFGESHANRFGKKAQVTLNTGAVLNLPVTGLSGGYFLDDRNVIGLSYFKYSEDSSSSDDDEDDENGNSYEYTDEESLYSGNAFQVYYQYYVSNSFYFRPSLSYRNQTTIDQRKTTYDTFNDRVIERVEDGKATYQDLVLGATIGNQWQWDNFTIGCDWIGFGERVAILGYDGDKSDFAANGTLTLLHLYVGASF
ncbi:hypothetical protein N9N67_10485 [Bacteriovoracaceae bacterium]|nr:hypothetical protein [Bacteriovoracaceae bacterium]